MERVYYTINESAAKTAHNMMSFSDYEEGSKTAGYKAMVDKAYELGEKVIQARPTEEERVKNLCERYSRRLAQNINKDIQIGMMCPSVMISGAGNFPVKKKEKQVAAWDKNHEDYKQVEEILHKIESIYYGKDVIKSDDENAIEKLQEKVDGLREQQEQMKAANKALRMSDAEKGYTLLRDMGYTDQQIAELRKPDYCGRIGYPAYLLSNNNANIRRLEERIKSLQATKSKGTQESENQFFKVVENTENMRLQLFFEGKPEPEVREVLKSNGFKWAPSQGAWQRQLTTNAKYALKSVIKKLEEMEAKE
jgi:hypothetical protein|nr:MAG TPA: protein of unknown function (DUF3560) [Caudoviricetes sp.]